MGAVVDMYVIVRLAIDSSFTALAPSDDELIVRYEEVTIIYTDISILTR